MGEAALGPGETGREIGEHARHAREHDPTSRHDRRISVAEAGLLALVALLAAWSGYAAAKWSTESRLTRGQGVCNPKRREHGRPRRARRTTGRRARSSTPGWACTRSGTRRPKQVAERRFRPVPEERVRCVARDRPGQRTRTHPRVRRRCPSTSNPTSATRERLKAEADSLTAEGSDQGQTARRLRQDDGVPRVDPVPRRHQHAVPRARGALRVAGARRCDPRRVGDPAHRVGEAAGLNGSRAESATRSPSPAASAA